VSLRKWFPPSIKKGKRWYLIASHIRLVMSYRFEISWNFLCECRICVKIIKKSAKKENSKSLVGSVLRRSAIEFSTSVLITSSLRDCKLSKRFWICSRFFITLLKFSFLSCALRTNSWAICATYKDSSPCLSCSLSLSCTYICCSSLIIRSSFTGILTCWGTLGTIMMNAC
jgi:hypothetical protein